MRVLEEVPRRRPKMPLYVLLALAGLIAVAVATIWEIVGAVWKALS